MTTLANAILVILGVIWICAGVAGHTPSELGTVILGIILVVSGVRLQALQ